MCPSASLSFSQVPHVTVSSGIWGDGAQSPVPREPRSCQARSQAALGPLGPIQMAAFSGPYGAGPAEGTTAAVTGSV